MGHTVYYKWRGTGPRADRVAHSPLGHTAYWANGLHIEVDRGGPRGPDDGLQDHMQDKQTVPVGVAFETRLPVKKPPVVKSEYVRDE